MKILQIIPNFDMGGAETMCEGLSCQLKKLGADVAAVSLYDVDTVITGRLRAAGIRVLSPGKQPGLDVGCVFRLRKLLRAEKPDVIHTHLHALKYAAAASFGMGIPIIHTVHNVAEREAGPDKKLNQWLYTHGRAVPVSLSREVQKSVVDFYGLPGSDTPVILNGINLSNCVPKTDYALHEPAQILHVGRFYEQKNHACMVDAMEILRNKGIQAVLHFVGDGPLMEEVRKTVADRGLEDMIRFEGLSDQVFAMMHEADLFVLPSKWEGLPMTIIEAMGTGLPVIAANVGGVGDMILNGYSGVLIRPDAQALADAVEKLMGNDSLRSQMGENARMEAGRFSAETMARKYYALYQENCG